MIDGHNTTNEAACQALQAHYDKMSEDAAA